MKTIKKDFEERKKVIGIACHDKISKIYIIFIIIIYMYRVSHFESKIVILNQKFVRKNICNYFRFSK